MHPSGMSGKTYKVDETKHSATETTPFEYHGRVFLSETVPIDQRSRLSDYNDPRYDSLKSTLNFSRTVMWAEAFEQVVGHMLGSTMFGTIGR